METNEIQVSEKSKLLKNKEIINSEEAGKVDISEQAKDKKQEGKKKESHKNDNKAWLSQRVSELGEDKILYSSNSSGRHPYTREVLLLAELRGLKQVDMAEMCQVSQPQISQWLAGQSKATGEQLEVLIDHVSPLAPGKSFHIEEVVESVTLSLPEGWEQKAVRKYLECHVQGMPSIDTKSIEGYALSGVLSEESQALEALRCEYVESDKSLLEQKGKFENLKSLRDDELLTYENNLAEWDGSRDDYLEDNPEFAGLSVTDRNKILDRQYPAPEKSIIEQEKLKAALDNILARDCLVDELEKSYDSVLAQLVVDISILKESYEANRDEEVAKWKIERESRKIFGRYSDCIDLDCIVLGLDLSSIRRALEKTASLLYSGMKFTLVYTDNSGWEVKKREIEVSMEEVFLEYSEELFTKNSNEAYEIELEDIQICGKLIFGNSSSSEELDRIKCYQLFSNKLALVYRYMSGDNRHFKNISIFNDAIEALESAEENMNTKGYSAKHIDDLYESLALAGYKVPGFRSIY